VDPIQQLHTIRAEDQYVLVVGLGISGIESARFLRRSGINTRCVERTERTQYEAESRFAAGLPALERSGAECLFGVEGDGVLRHLDGVRLAILSPGIPLDAPLVEALRRVSVPFVGEFELGLALARSEYVAVTGSNGKTTTTTLIHAILSRHGVSSRLCGNVGTPVIAGIQDIDTPLEEILVAEASSYQLESSTVIHPHVGVFLNLSENHLERHGTLERYLDAKAKLFARQGSDDVAVLNADDDAARRLARRIDASLLWFGTSLTDDMEGARIEGSRVHLRTSRLGGATTVDLSDLPFEGEHNRYNVAAALLAASVYHVPPDAACATLRALSVLPHRIERLGFHDEREWINDSKSTTVASTVAAMTTVLPTCRGRLVLLVGGIAKEGSWGPLVSLLESKRDRVRHIICFGQDRELLLAHCGAGSVRCSASPTLIDAVRHAANEAQPGDTVLLSPACASFDEFRGYEERGDAFRRMVQSHTWSE
jgi:UDP-N-acetylmuramoylalanine--D-glutamate ligase